VLELTLSEDAFGLLGLGILAGKLNPAAAIWDKKQLEKKRLCT